MTAPSAARPLADSARWHVLGAGSIVPREGYGCAGYALRTHAGAAVTLFDCGPGSLRMLPRVGIELAEVERVVLSHFHTDHWLDLYALFFARRNPALRVGPLEVIGPVGLRARIAAAPAALGPWVVDPSARLCEVEPDARGRVQLERDGLRLSATLTGHAPEALAWRADFETPRGPRSVCFSGDTGENPAVAELARAADLCVFECSFPDEAEVPQHLTPSSAARLARSAQAQSLLLTHFYPALEPAQARARAALTYAGPIETARDGAVHAFT
jgi:ribonuclease BN (tRNA processing enzyme)